MSIVTRQCTTNLYTVLGEISREEDILSEEDQQLIPEVKKQGKRFLVRGVFTSQRSTEGILLKIRELKADGIEISFGFSEFDNEKVGKIIDAIFFNIRHLKLADTFFVSLNLTQFETLQDGTEVVKSFFNQGGHRIVPQTLE